jgi:hypothetical protein
VWDRVDPLGADLGVNPEEAGLAGLPYSLLSGAQFERLIYELLQSENQRPWFFGRSGQAQYGIDIVTQVSGKQDVYQCKNYKEVPAWSDVRDAVQKFESEWLNDMSLPAPREFVYCCPQPLDDESLLVKWETFKDAFHKRTGVVISFWDRNAIDSRLRRLPDLVAGLFSDSYAEHFCGRDDWRDDPWVRVKQSPARFPVINRFLDKHNRHAIYVEKAQEELFIKILDENSSVAFRGLPGMGKSFLALELSSRLRQPLRRIYYATFKDAVSVEQLWQSARRRLSLSSLFFLDDCHLAYPTVGYLLERLDPELRSGKLKLVLSMRDQVGGAADQLDDTPTWLSLLNEEQAVIDLRTNVGRTLAVTCHLRPDFTGLSPSRLDRLHKTCGGDLLLLDEILRNIHVPQDIDSLNVSDVLGSVRTNYFNGNYMLPTLARLAALAQFDILPRADFFEGQWWPEEKTTADPLMTRLFAPPRYQFLHSSLATLVLRALAQLESTADTLDDQVATITVDVVRGYLSYLSTTAGDSDEFARVVGQFLRTDAHLSSDIREARIRSAVLGATAIQATIEGSLASQSFHNLALCIYWLNAAEHPAKARYTELIQNRFGILFEEASVGSDVIGMSTLSNGLSALRRFAPDTQLALLNEHGPDAFMRLILSTGTLFQMFKVLENATPIFRTALLDQFNSEQAETLIDKTIAAGRSIGTLNFRMRELRDSAPDMLARLERAIGARGFLRLILANGTLPDLFRVLQYSSPTLQTELLDQFSFQESEALIDRTIATGRSIGTLNLAMRELGDSEPQILARLERAVGARGVLRLILANGTLADLFKLLEHSSPTLRTELLDQFTAEQAATLVDKTIATGRSIGTLNLAMRELGDSEPQILARLERAVGARSFLRLILANGTLIELFKLLEHSSPTLRTELLDQFTAEQAAALVDKTIATGRSIGTLNLAMRELYDSEPQMLARLERAVGARSFLRLILANGTLIELFRVLRYSGPALRTELLDQLTTEQAATLVDKTIAKAQRIESFHFTLYSRVGELDHLLRLEELIGVDGWWRLLINCGTLNSLSQITHAMSVDFRQQMITAAANVSVLHWREMIERGFFRNACDFTTNDVLSYSTVARDAFRAALEMTVTPLAARASWFDLNSSRPPDELADEGAVLRAALRIRIEAVQVTGLFELNLREAVSAFAFCWRERPDLRIELVKNLRRILPAREIWPREKGEMATLRLILSLARSTEFPETEARWLLREITTFLDREVSEDTNTISLLLLIWNIGALSYDRKLVNKLGKAFPHAIRELLVADLAKRISPKGSNEEKLWQLALGGLLFFLFPGQKSVIIDALKPLKGATRWLVELAMEQTFVPALFALEGMALLTDHKRVFTPSTCLELLRKFEDYSDIGPAMNNLRVRVNRYAELTAGPWFVLLFGNSVKLTE